MHTPCQVLVIPTKWGRHYEIALNLVGSFYRHLGLVGADHLPMFSFLALLYKKMNQHFFLSYLTTGGMHGIG